MAKKVVIIGGGFAGLACARSLANNNDFEVTLLDKQNHHLFQPLLYQLASATLGATDIARSLRGIMSKARNISVFLDHAYNIDPEQKIVQGKERQYAYDYLLIASGTRTSWFGNKEWEKHTIGLKNLSDAYRIRQKVLSSLEKAEIIDDPQEQQRLMTVLIVGAGPTGVELAGAFEDLVQHALTSDFRRIDPANLRTILVQSGDRILKGFSLKQAEAAKKHLEDNGVEVMLNDRVVDVCDGKVSLKSGSTIEAETIIWAAGVQASRIACCLDVEKDRSGRIVVGEDLSIPQYRNIFVAGDVANCTDSSGVEVPGLAPAAMQMGKHVADILLNEQRVDPSSSDEVKLSLRTSFEYWDKGIMAIVGRNFAVVDGGKFQLSGRLGWLAWLFIHILFLVGFRNKLSVLLQWSFAYIQRKPGSRVFGLRDSKWEKNSEEQSGC